MLLLLVARQVGEDLEEKNINEKKENKLRNYAPLQWKLHMCNDDKIALLIVFGALCEFWSGPGTRD